MHRNQSRPHPLPPLHASAWGTASAVLDPKGYFNTLDEVFAWADQNATLHTVHVEETLPEWAYRSNGRIFRKRCGGWTREDNTETVVDVVMKSMFGVVRR